MVRLSLLMLAIGSVPLATSASCPYIAGNHADAAASHLSGRDAAEEDVSVFGQCSRKSKVAGGGTRSRDFWPCELSLATLRQNAEIVNPMDADFDYATEFAKLDGTIKRRNLCFLT